jgi:creatinine amidohydrolase
MIDTKPQQRSWRWEDLTADDFAEAVRLAEGVCILPLGCLEKHGDHLPLGTDIFQARVMAERAAAIEPAVIFPWYAVSQIAEARHAPGTLSYSHRLRWAMLEETIDECARNGLRRVVILNGHGGDIDFLRYFAACQPERRRDALVYIAYPWIDDAPIKAVIETSIDGHGGENETSQMLRIAPGLVKMMRATPMSDLLAPPPVLRVEGLRTGFDWYARCPSHYYGDGRAGTAEKGEVIIDSYSRRVAAMLRAVKDDREIPVIAERFHALAEEPSERKPLVAKAR